MRNTINLISNIWNPVGPSVSGGLEVFNYYLAQELKKQNNDVSLFASGDSEKIDCLRPIIDISFSKRGDKYLSEPWNYRRITVEEFAIYTDIVQDIKENEVTHFSLVNFLPIYLAAKRGLKTVTTLHMPVTNFHYQTLRKLLSPKELKSVHLVGISKAQVKNFPEVFRVIPNGVNTDEFAFLPQGRESFIWIGRIIPEKGAKDAILAANKGQVQLELAGAPRVKNEQEYFDKEMQPNFTDLIKHKGFVKGDERKQFYGGKALIFPSKWEEAFGLTMIEALSCGTPVIAYDRGAVREVVEHGVTGFIVQPDDIDGLADAMNKINSMSKEQYLKMRRNCRDSVEEDFSLSSMAQQYIKLYQEVLDE